MDNINEKIKKCLRLAKSANPNEAAIALRQAQKLAAAHGLSLDGFADGYSESVRTPERLRPRLQEWLLTLVGLVARCCGVGACTDVSGKYRAIQYMGIEHRVKMAVHAHIVLQRAMDEGWGDLPQYMKSGQKGSHSSYRIGWLAGVARSVEAYAMTEQDNAAISAQKKANKVEKEAVAIKQCRVEENVMRKGFADGSEFKLNRGVGGFSEGQKLLGS